MVSGWDTVLSRAMLARWALLVYGIAVVVFAVSPAYVVGLLALVVVGGGFLVVISSTNTSVQVIVGWEASGGVVDVTMLTRSSSKSSSRVR